MTTPADGGHYVAIGSSFAAGPGITPLATGRPAKARQSERNYPHLLAQRCGYDLTDVTSSGATVDDILRAPQFGQAAQLAAVTAETDLVTVTAGGNDIGYVPSLVAASLPGWISMLPVLGHRLRRATAPSRSGDRCDLAANGVGQVFGAVRRRAPGARIVCVDYLTVLPPTFLPDLPFDEPTYDELVGLARDLDLGLARAAAEHDVDLVEISRHSVDHHAWSDEPWTSGWVRPRRGGAAAFHPTARGMTAVADLLAGLLATPR